VTAPTRILVVDDNPSNLEILHEILDGEYSVDTACDGREAIRIASEHLPRVVLLDVMLPGIDGYETCRRLRALPGMHQALIVMLSAKAMPSERALGLDAGADDYITKPFDDSELLTVIRSCRTIVVNSETMRLRTNGPTIHN
jgi:two-component system cell cycle response regulator